VLFTPFLSGAQGQQGQQGQQGKFDGGSNSIAVPLPASLSLIATGAALIAIVMLRRRR